MTAPLRSAAPKRPASGTRGAATLLAVYVVLLVWLVVFKLHAPHVGDPSERAIKLVPFVRSGDAGASAAWEVAANFAIFAPLGLYLGILMPAWSWVRLTAVLAATSLALESAQYVLAVGKSDATDVLVNTAGGLAGVVLCALVRRALGERAGVVLTRFLAVGTVVVVLAGALLLSGPRHSPPAAPDCASACDVPGG